MSGHSKWANIQHRKGRQDAKRSNLWTKLVREIIVAARVGGGGDPDMNSRLRLAVLKAREGNVPKDTINNAILKGTGQLEGVSYEEVRYEGYGVGGAALIIDCTTDNRVRTVADVRHYFDKYGAGLGNAGCVSWQFEQKGVLIIERGDLDEDETMMTVLDAGADDFQADEDCFQIYTAPEDFSAVRDALTEAGFEFAQAEIQMVPQNTITLESQEDMAQLRKLLDSLEDNDDVQHVWHNWENEDDYEE